MSTDQLGAPVECPSSPVRPSHDGPAAISIRDLIVEFGAFRALNGVSVEFSGRSVGLLGPNGAGKSTLIKTMLGLVRPNRGQARIFGRDVARDVIEIRRLVGYVPEKDCHVPQMSAIDFVTMGGELAGMPRTDAVQRAHEMLRFVGLGEARYRAVDGYSTGMKQRIKLAQALVHDPKMIFLDEPTNGLDPEGRVDLLGILRDLSRMKGIRILISSHLLRDIEFVCDDVIVMAKGTVVRQSTIQDLKHISDRHWRVRVRGDLARFVAAMVGCGSKIDAIGRDSYSIELPCDDSSLILSAARASACQVREMIRQELTLEDAFIETLRANPGGA